MEAVQARARTITITTVATVATTAVTAGLVMRFWVRSDLWLDEALTVNIARLPLAHIPGALRHDGAPPLYYFLLHVWMTMFGSGNAAARSLSGCCAVAALPLMWAAGRRVGGHSAAVAALVLLASSPFAIRFATEARMYALLVLLVLLGFLALTTALERPAPGPLAAVAAVTGGLLLTHYWAVYLVLATGLALLPQALRLDPHRRARVRLAAVAAPDAPRRADGQRRAARASLAAMGVGVLLFLPWLPVFLYQTFHTATPWASAPDPVVIVDTLYDYAGGHVGPGPFLVLVFLALLGLGMFGRGLDGRRIEIDLRTRPRGRPVAFVAFGAMVLAVLVSEVLRAGFVVRYTAAVFPLLVLVAALGAANLLDERVRTAVLLAAVALGMAVSGMVASVNRTQAAEAAHAIATGAQPGDVVVYCPDQLGPAVSRLLDAPVRQLTYPRWSSPDRVDWADYAAVNGRADPLAFAHRLQVEAAGRDIWLVWAKGYRTFHGACTKLAQRLTALRPGREPEVLARLDRFEHETVDRFPPP